MSLPILKDDILEKPLRGDKFALVSFDGFGVTENGHIAKHNWFSGLDTSSAAYADILLTPEEARGIMLAHRRMKTGASVSTVLQCWGKDVCPMSRVCPLVALQDKLDGEGIERRVIPIGKRCHPPGTMIHLTKDKSVPIEDLDPEKHKVMTWWRKQNLIKSAEGSSFSLHSREYAGDLIKIEAAGREHKVTPEHISIVRFRKEAASLFCVYLMRKGNMWRVGRTKLINTYDCPKAKVKSLFGPGQRAAKEGADELWVLGVYESIAEAHLGEEFHAIQFGASRAAFTDSMARIRSKHDGFSKWVTRAQLEEHHNSLSKPRCHYAQKLALLGLSIEAPFWSKENPLVLGRMHGISLSHPFAIYACNIIDKAMLTLVMHQEKTIRRTKYTTEWVPLKTSREPYKGKVYSLDVEVNKTYVANGIVTHNCPIEEDLFKNALSQLVEEFDIGEGQYTDQRQILELAEIEVLENRVNAKMASDPEFQDGTELKLTNTSTTTTKEGHELVVDNYVKDVNDYMKIKEKLWARKDKLRKELLATRRERELMNVKQGQQASDASTVAAAVLAQLKQLRSTQRGV